MKNKKISKIRKTKKNKKIDKITMLMKKKLVVLFLCIVIALTALGIRIAIISTKDGTNYQKQILAQNSYNSTVLQYKRGDILDRNGAILATSEKVYTLVIDCYAINQKEEYIEQTIATLVSMFGLEEKESEIRDKITNEATKNSQYQVLKKEVSVMEKVKFDDYVNNKAEEKITEEEEAKRISIKGGVYFEDDYVRRYPEGTLASTVIGFSNFNGDGSAGLEQSYDSILRGTNGRIYGYLNQDLELQRMIKEPENGKTLISTLDRNIQSVIERTIVEFNEQYQNGPNEETAGRGYRNIGILVCDPQTGEILAIATGTSYNLNNPQDLSVYYTEAEIAEFAANDELQKTLAEAKARGEKVDESVIGTTTVEALSKLWSNYAVANEYEPGSTFKPITVASAIESGKLDVNKTFECSGSYFIEGIEITCAYGISHGHQTVSGIIENSCNVGLMQVGQLLGEENFLKYASIFNLGKSTGIDLPNEIAGTVHNAETMTELELATSTFGQSFELSMVQEMAAFNSLINGGYYYQPHTVKQILDENGNVLQNIEPVLLRQTVSANTSSLLKSYLYNTIEGTGSGSNVKIEGYAIGGKTGTAEKLPRGNEKYLVSFIGFAPVDNPRVSVYVVIDEPNLENQSNSGLAQELSRKIFGEILPYLNVFKDRSVIETEVTPVAEVIPEAEAMPEIEATPEEEPSYEEPDYEEPEEE